MSTVQNTVNRDDQLRRKQRNYETLLFTAPVAICAVDAELHVTLWSAGAERIFGWRAEEVLERPFPIIGPAERPVFEAYCHGALAGQSTRRIETKAQTRTGAMIDVALSMSPLFDEAGGVEWALLVADVITDQKQAERRIHLQNRVAQTLSRAKSIDEGIHAALTLLCSLNGWDCGEFWMSERDGRALKRKSTVHLPSVHGEQFDRGLAARNDSETDGLIRRVLGSPRPVLFKNIAMDRSVDRSLLAAQCGLNDAIGVRIANGNQVLGAVLFCAEQITTLDSPLEESLATIGEQLGQFLLQKTTETSLRGAEERLVHSQKLELLGRLVGGVVHDFNNLMTIILGYGELLLDGTATENLGQEAHREILDAANHATQLTSRLLAFSRKEPSSPVLVSINLVIQQLETIICRLVGKDVKVQFDLPSTVGQFRADPTQVEQLLLNLVVNARDALQAGGRLTIRTGNVEIDKSNAASFPGALPGTYVTLTVSDTGCGMDEAVQERIFDPFFTTKPAGKGTGIGLATVHDIVRQSGGFIRVESKPAEGTTFECLFPAGAAGLESWVVDSAPDAPATGKETVLVVDDEMRVRRLLCLILRARGYQVLEADGPLSAIEICHTHPGAIDLLIADMVMPCLSGAALADRLAKSRPDLAVLLISGYTGAEIICDMTDSQRRPFLTKPFTSHELASTVRRLLD